MFLVNTPSIGLGHVRGGGDGPPTGAVDCSGRFGGPFKQLGYLAASALSLQQRVRFRMVTAGFVVGHIVADIPVTPAVTL